MGFPVYEALEKRESELSGARLMPRNVWSPETIDAPSPPHHTGPALPFGHDGCSHFATQRLGYLNHDFDVRATVGSHEGAFAPGCPDHTGGGCC